MRQSEDVSVSNLDVDAMFENSLTSVERTQTRVAIIERLGTTLGTDDVDVIPLS